MGWSEGGKEGGVRKSVSCEVEEIRQQGLQKRVSAQNSCYHSRGTFRSRGWAHLKPTTETLPTERASINLPRDTKTLTKNTNTDNYNAAEAAPCTRIRAPPEMRSTPPSHALQVTSMSKRQRKYAGGSKRRLRQKKRSACSCDRSPPLHSPAATNRLGHDE